MQIFSEKDLHIKFLTDRYTKKHKEDLKDMVFLKYDSLFKTILLVD